MDSLTQFWKDYPQYAKAPKRPAWFSIIYTPLSNGAVQAQSSVQIGVDADFIATSVSVTKTNAANSAYIVLPILITLVYQAGSMNMTSTKVDLDSLANTQTMNQSNENGVFAYPLVVPKASQLTSGADNATGADMNVWITFAGFKAFV